MVWHKTTLSFALQTLYLTKAYSLAKIPQMNWDTPNKQQLVQAFLLLQTADEVKRFLRDLLTESEIDEFAKRFQAAEMLAAKVSYTQIEKETGLSSTTIARVSKYLAGKEAGYSTVLKKLRHHTSTQKRRDVS